jgi:hypothetical protein
MLRAVQVIITESWPFVGDEELCGWPDDDGYWGPITKAAVACYQSYRGLSPDGVVGPMTWGAHDPTHYALMGEIHYTGSSGGKAWYKTDWTYDRFYRLTSTQYWYIFKYSHPSQYTGMWAAGPDYS